VTVAGPDPAAVRITLERHFGEIDKPILDPLDELVLTILSQSTTDANRDRAYEALRRRFTTWQAVRDAARADVEDAVRIAGLGGQKARSIQRALDRLAEERSTPTLDHLREMSDDEAIGYLTSFDGVGVKTAACVLCFSLRRPVLPVDTHVLRIARRLGWIPSNCTAPRAHGLLAERVSPEDRFVLHMQLITLGRTSCVARAPVCADCPLKEDCPRIGVD
jgi:endonuclease-3